MASSIGRAKESRGLPHLVYLEEDAEGFGWLAIDDHGREYNLTTHLGVIEVTGTLHYQFERQGPPPTTRADILDSMRVKFDVTLLESGDRCECGYVFNIEAVPRYCPRCSRRLLPLQVWSLAIGNPAETPAYLAKLAGDPKIYWTGKVDDGRPLWVLWSGRRLVAAIADSEHEEEYFDILADEIVDAKEAIPTHILEIGEHPLMAALDLAAVKCGSCCSMKAGTTARCDFCGCRTRTPDEKERLFGWLPTWFCVRVEWYRGGSELMRYDTLPAAWQARDYQYLENSQQCRMAVYVGRRINWLELFFGWLAKYSKSEKQDGQ